MHPMFRCVIYVLPYNLQCIKPHIELFLCIPTCNILTYFFSLQKKLNTMTMESDRLKTEIAARNDLLSKIDVETVVVEEVIMI